MNRLFGKQSKESKPTLDDASQRVDERVKSVDGRIAKIDAELRKLKEQIQRSSGSTQQRYKQRAMQLLQQKRSYEKQQDTMMAQQFNVDQLKFTVDTMKDTQTQVTAMKGAHKSLKKDLSKFNIDKIENLQEDLAELYYDTQEIQEIMGRAYDVPDDIDETEMLAELDTLDDAGIDLDSDYLSAPLVPLPAGPIQVGQPAEPEPELSLIKEKRDRGIEFIFALDFFFSTRVPCLVFQRRDFETAPQEDFEAPPCQTLPLFLSRCLAVVVLISITQPATPQTSSSPLRLWFALPLDPSLRMNMNNLLEQFPVPGCRPGGSRPPALLPGPCPQTPLAGCGGLVAALLHRLPAPPLATATPDPPNPNPNLRSGELAPQLEPSRVSSGRGVTAALLEQYPLPAPPPSYPRLLQDLLRKFPPPTPPRNPEHAERTPNRDVAEGAASMHCSSPRSPAAVCVALQPPLPCAVLDVFGPLAGGCTSADGEALALLFPAVHQQRLYRTAEAFTAHCQEIEHTLYCSEEPIIPVHESASPGGLPRREADPPADPLVPHTFLGYVLYNRFRDAVASTLPADPSGATPGESHLRFWWTHTLAATAAAVTAARLEEQPPPYLNGICGPGSGAPCAATPYVCWTSWPDVTAWMVASLQAPPWTNVPLESALRRRLATCLAEEVVRLCRQTERCWRLEEAGADEPIESPPVLKKRRQWGRAAPLLTAPADSTLLLVAEMIVADWMSDAPRELHGSSALLCS
eukprot:gene5603-4025_t